MVPPHISSTEGYRQDASTLQQLNQLNLKLHERTTSQLFLTRTDLGGVICLRMSTGSLRTEKQHVLTAFETLEKEAKVITEELIATNTSIQ
ncbi:hypothetical protein FRC19_002390 [Serendipita sp. 401]|nr:hypothetical protein FRC18_004606 [Serendipita sp. 400]KAG8813477.1 hypothetical protein FRC19_002390 [Serendipita sp. 401]